jgi:hypothetical protein
MARQPNKTIKKAAVPTPVGLNERGTTGLHMSNGQVFEEINADLRYPASLQTYKLMSYDPTVAAAVNTIKSLVRRTEYNVVYDDVEDGDLTDEQKQMASLITQCMHDMEHTWSDFMNEAISIIEYGYSIHEKVYKRRRGLTGKYKSKYDDELLGWAKLPIRSQDTIYKWLYDAKGQRLLAVEQDLSAVNGRYYLAGENIGKGFSSTKIKLPMSKILHLTHDMKRGNPEGSSILRSCYVPWKYKSKIEEYEAIGIARDLGGLPIVELPPEYMSENASEDKKAVFAYMKDVIRNIHANEQAGLVMPKFVDPETKQDIFGFRLEGVSGGGKQYDTDAIIKRYENKILMTFLADVLKMGQDSTGSYALSDSKTNLLAVGISAIMNEILDIVNRDLIPQTLLMNGFDISGELPVIRHGDLDERDIDKLGKFVQQTVTSGAMEVDEGLSEWLRTAIGAPSPNREKPMTEEMTSGSESQAGQGDGTSGPTGQNQQSGMKVSNEN